MSINSRRLNFLNSLLGRKNEQPSPSPLPGQLQGLDLSPTIKEIMNSPVVPISPSEDEPPSPRELTRPSSTRGYHKFFPF